MDFLRDDTIWISAKAGPVLFGPSFLSPSLDISQALSCPIYVPCSGLLFSLFCASLFLCYVPCQTDRHWLKWDFADSSFGTGCTISSISQLNYMPLLAQWKSCVLQAVAHWLCKSMCSCDQPSKEMQWEASGSWQTIHRSALHSWVRREKERGAETQTLSSVYAYQLLGYLHELFYALCKVRTNSMLYSFWA